MTVDRAAANQAAANNVHIALREATQALTVAMVSRRRLPVLSVSDAHLLCADVAALLDAAAKLLRSAGLEVLPTSVVAHRLQALVQHLAAGVSIADREPRVDGDGVGPSLWGLQRPMSTTPDD
jgi:hypothetical protein